MTPDEVVLTFDCQGEELIGILTYPPTAAGIGVIVIVGGPQYRIGSHRQFTLLARSLANAGFPCLRFDHRGIGDSSGETRDFKGLDEDIRVAIDAFQAQIPGIGRFVLWGLCDAASAILMYQARSRDKRIAGMMLLNPWVRSEATLATARIRGYYKQRVLNPDFWSKLLRGGVNPLQSLAEYFGNLRSMGRRNSVPQGFQETMLSGLESFTKPVQFVLSGEDLTAQEFLALCARDPRWRQACQSSNVQCETVAGADHTFSCGQWRAAVERLTCAWLEKTVSQ